MYLYIPQISKCFKEVYSLAWGHVLEYVPSSNACLHAVGERGTFLHLCHSGEVIILGKPVEWSRSFGYPMKGLSIIAFQLSLHSSFHASRLNPQIPSHTPIYPHMYC